MVFTSILPSWSQQKETSPIRQHEEAPKDINSDPATDITSAAGLQTKHIPTQPKLRRKAPLADTLNELTAVQRLVEYFCVVSSQPRWQESNEKEKEQKGAANDGDTNSHRRGRFSGLRNARLSFRHRGGSAVAKSDSGRAIRKRHSSKRGKADLTRDNDQVPPVDSSSASSSSDSNNKKTSSDGNGRTEGNIHMSDSSSHHDYNFRPTVTARFPATDHEDNPFNPMILQFCYPSGDVIVPSRTYEMPRVHHFVLTNERGRKVYGTCLTVFEEYVPSSPDNPWSSHSMTHHEEDSATEAGRGKSRASDDMNDDAESGFEISVSDKRRRATLYLPKVLCLLSTWPYLTAFREYLAQIYRLATATNTMTAPIERYILNLCCEIPAPPPGAYEVQVSILDSTIRFWAPPAKLPLAYVALPYKILFECLDLDNILKLWCALIMERKVLLLSSQYSILTVCSEILCSLLFPMRWSHLYVPLLPRMMSPMLDAPVPYLCGIARENWLHAQMFVSGDTIVVDLDHNTVKLGDAVSPLPAAPAKKYNKLKATLSETVGHVFWRARGLERDYREVMKKKSHKRYPELLRYKRGASGSWMEKLSGLDHAFNLAYTPDSANLLNDTLPEGEQKMWDRVQETFLRFFVALLKDYRRFLTIPKQSNKLGAPPPLKPTFDRIGFLAGQKPESAEFLVEMCMTQQFDDFLTRRMYSPGEPDLVFFDQSIDAKLNRSRLRLRKLDTPFLHSAKAHKELKKLRAVEPSGDGLPEYDGGPDLKHYVYKTWPDEFDDNLFCNPRPIPKMISAEFDRQSVLVAKLRARVVSDTDDDSILEFYGGDYDSSPEVAAFTVFFFVYSALIGREWQEYQQSRLVAEVQATRMAGKEEKRDTEVDEAPKESGEDVIPDLEVSPTEQLAVDGCLADLSMGVCEACPVDSLILLKSALVYCSDGAQDVYSSMFKATANQVAELQLRLNTQEERALSKLDADELIVEYEEAREVAASQLDLGFEVLTTMSMRKLSADSDAYLSLMEACGRCGDTQRALHLIELMRNDGFVADSEVLACFVSAFAHDDIGGLDIGSSVPARDPEKSDTPADHDAYSKYLQKRLAAAAVSHNDEPPDSPQRPEQMALALALSSLKVSCGAVKGVPEKDDTLEEVTSDVGSLPSDWSEKSPTGGSAFLDWVSQNQNGRKKPRRRKRRKSSTVEDHLATSKMVSSQLDLGEALLDFLYPDLVIDTNSDSCPHCSNVLSENDIVAGWSPCAFQDYTSKCPKCEHRFVPRFSVSCSAESFEGSQGPQTPLYCEFLSPWALRRQLQSVVKGDVGIQGMLDPSWREGTDIQATIFWNLMFLCRRYRLPFSFLLQGSFQNNRTILPRPPVAM